MLKESIARDGLYVPIIVNQNGVILDGHHRYKACKELDKLPIPLDKIEVRYFDNPLYEKLFVININLNRRHLNDYQKVKLVLVKKPVLEEIAKRNQEAKLPQQGQEGFQSISDKHLSQMNRVNEALGEQVGVSYETVRKVEFIEEKATTKQKEMLEKDQISINKVFQDLNGQVQA